MKIIDGSGIVMGRLASRAAKELIKGEEIVIVNCEEVIITGNRKTFEKEFSEKRSKMGSSLKGPKHLRSSERIVKRCIRGMIPNHREGRGLEMFKKVKCYKNVPKELEGKKFETIKQGIKIKKNKINQLNK